MPADYHTHTPLCHHAEGEPEEYVDAAIAAGVTEYGISCHAPVKKEFFDDWRMAYADLEKYYAWIERARKHAAGRIPVRAGLECDWLPGCAEWVKHLRSLYDWDYFIGSVHYLNDWDSGNPWDFDNPKWLGRWASEDVEKVWARYWKEYTAMAESQLFEVMGHADLIKKFSYRPAGELYHYYEPAVEAIAAGGAVVELNTAGWHKPCQEAYPAKEFLELCRGAGVPLIISSDAHAPRELGRDFSRALHLAQEAGYNESALLERGKIRKSENFF